MDGQKFTTALLHGQNIIDLFAVNMIDGINFDTSKLYISPSKERIFAFVNEGWKEYIRTDLVTQKIEPRNKHFFEVKCKSCSVTAAYTIYEKECWNCGKEI